MKLYNQSDRRLSWDMGGRRFECEPFGSVAVPEALVSFAERRGLPLAASPVAAETRAAQKAARAKREAEEGDLLVLRNQLADSEAALSQARALLEQEQAEHVRTGKERDKLAAQAEKQADTIADLRKELKATEAKLREDQAKLAELEQAIGRSAGGPAATNDEDGGDAGTSGADDKKPSDLPDDKDELLKMAKELELEGVDGRSSVDKLKAAITAALS